MDAALRDHARWLECKLARMDWRPELHRHQRAAIRRYLALAGEAASPGDYMARSGGVFELVRAEWLDRHFGLIHVHAAVRDDRRRAAARLAYDAGLAATGHGDFIARTIEAKQRAAPLERAADDATTAIAPMCAALLEWATAEEEAARTAQLENVLGCWQRLGTAEPGIDWATLCAAPWYRRRLPFDDAGLAVVGRWLARATGGAAPTREADAPGDLADELDDLRAAAAAYARSVPVAPPARDTEPAIAVPSAAAAAAGYGALAAALDPDAPADRAARAVCDRIQALAAGAGNADELGLRMEQEDLPLALARDPALVRAEAELARAQASGQQLLETHARARRDLLAGAGTTTELAIELAYLEACADVETAWAELYVTAATRALRAALGWEHSPTEAQRRAIVTSYRASVELCGGDWDDLVGSPAVAGFVDRVLAPRGQRFGGDSGDDHAYRGEVGLRLVRELQHWSARRLAAELERMQAPDPERVAALMQPRFARGAELSAHARALLDAATGGGHAYVGRIRGRRGRAGSDRCGASSCARTRSPRPFPGHRGRPSSCRGSTGAVLRISDRVGASPWQTTRNAARSRARPPPKGRPSPSAPCTCRAGAAWPCRKRGWTTWSRSARPAASSS